MLTCTNTVYRYFKRKSRLLSNRLSNVRLNLEISNVKAGLKKCCSFFFKKNVYCFFPVNTERDTTSAVAFRARFIGS